LWSNDARHNPWLTFICSADHRASGFQFNYWFVLPGLLAYGAGLAVVLTVNDPLILSDVPDAD
jgi:hypothetical protein